MFEPEFLIVRLIGLFSTNPSVVCVTLLKTQKLLFYKYNFILYDSVPPPTGPVIDDESREKCIETFLHRGYQQTSSPIPSHIIEIKKVKLRGLKTFFRIEIRSPAPPQSWRSRKQRGDRREFPTYRVSIPPPPRGGGILFLLIQSSNCCGRVLLNRYRWGLSICHRA